MSKDLALKCQVFLDFMAKSSEGDLVGFDGRELFKKIWQRDLKVPLFFMFVSYW